MLEGRNAAAKHGGMLLGKCIQVFRRGMTEENVEDTPGLLSGNRIDGKISAETSITNNDAISSSTNLYEVPLGRDLLSEMANANVSTALWLEKPDMIALLEQRFDDSDFLWDALF